MAMVKIEIRECIKWSLTTGQKQWKIINSQAQKVVAVAYRRWCFTRGSNCKALTRKLWCFGLAATYGRWSLTRGGHTWRFDCTVKPRLTATSVIRSSRYYSHFFRPPGKNHQTLSCKTTLVNMANFFGSLVTVLTGFHCISFPNMNLIMGTSWF